MVIMDVVKTGTRRQHHFEGGAVEIERSIVDPFFHVCNDSVCVYWWIELFVYVCEYICMCVGVCAWVEARGGGVK